MFSLLKERKAFPCITSKQEENLIDRNFLYQVLFFLPSPVVEEHRAAGYDDDHAAYPLVDQPPI